MTLSIRKVVIVCGPADFELLAITTPRIVEAVAAHDYELIVADDAVARARPLAHPRFDVFGLSELPSWPQIAAAVTALATAACPAADGMPLRLAKLAALTRLRPDDIGLLWEANTLPLKPLVFATGTGQPACYRSATTDPRHAAAISGLTGLTRTDPRGHAANSLPVRGRWLHEIWRTLETQTGKPWWQAVIDQVVALASPAVFNEYEYLGTCIAALFPGQLADLPGRWFRYGNALYGSPVNLTDDLASRLAADVDYVSFEHDDTVPFRGLQIGTGPQRLEKTIFENRMLNSDIEPFFTTDITLDITRTPWYIRANSLEQVTCNSVIEHIDDVVGLFREIDRCLLPGGLIVFAVPFIGSYNHGTDITHKRGFTFDAFNFLVNDRSNYFYRFPDRRPFDYRCVMFWRENVVEGKLVHERFDQIPARADTGPWVERVLRHEIPGSFGYIFQKAGAK